MDEDWAVLTSFLPERWRELASETGALKGLRKDKSVESVLRVLLPMEPNLRSTGRAPAAPSIPMSRLPHRRQLKQVDAYGGRNGEGEGRPGVAHGLLLRRDALSARKCPEAPIIAEINPCQPRSARGLRGFRSRAGPEAPAEGRRPNAACGQYAGGMSSTAARMRPAMPSAFHVNRVSSVARSVRRVATAVSSPALVASPPRPAPAVKAEAVATRRIPVRRSALRSRSRRRSRLRSPP